MHPCEHLYLVSTVAYQLSACPDKKDPVSLAADLVVLSDMLANILAWNSKHDNSPLKDEGEDCL